MAPKKEKDKPPQFMTINGQQCQRVKDASTGKFVYRPVQDDTSARNSGNPSLWQNSKDNEDEEKKWLQQKEREVQELRWQESRQQTIQERRQKEKVGLIEKVPGRRREPKVPVPATLRKLREEHDAALAVGMKDSRPKQFALIQEALEIEESRYQAKVKAAKERAYRKTRGHLRLEGEAGLDDSGSDAEDGREHDGALVPKQELHDIEDYRRDLPRAGSGKDPQAMANGAPAPEKEVRGHKEPRQRKELPGATSGHAPVQRPSSAKAQKEAHNISGAGRRDKAPLSMDSLQEALPEPGGGPEPRRLHSGRGGRSSRGRGRGRHVGDAQHGTEGRGASGASSDGPRVNAPGSRGGSGDRRGRGHAVGVSARGAAVAAGGGWRGQP
uniref:Uncharacterized protein n=1 Tax=Tetraselmis sp. GSL018 TaxID=582737 RepID=A0A061SPA1_9CHLO